MSNSFSSGPGCIRLEDAIDHIVREVRRRHGATLSRYGLPRLLTPGVPAQVKQLRVPQNQALYYQIQLAWMALELEFSSRPAAKTPDAIALSDWLTTLMGIVAAFQGGAP